MMKVPMLDLRAQYAALKPEIDAAVLEVLEQQCFRGGPAVESFENELAEFAGVRFAVGVGSGTDALFLTLKALNLQPGDEVITTPFTFFATAGAIVNAGGVPVFADIEEDTFTMDPNLVESLVTPRTKAILPVHLFGQCANMEALQDIACRRGLHIVEDAAQALGARRWDRSAGTWGDAGALSFYPTKNLGGAGEGGAILCNNAKIVERLRMLRCHGASSLYQHVMVGFNSHLHALQAAVLRVKLAHLPRWNEQRRERARYYDEQLRGCDAIRLPRQAEGNYHVYHQYVVRIPRRDEARRLFEEREIGCGVFYPTPLHQQPCFRTVMAEKTSCPHAERVCTEVLALPIYPELTVQQQQAVCEVLSENIKNV